MPDHHKAANTIIFWYRYQRRKTKKGVSGLCINLVKLEVERTNDQLFEEEFEEDVQNLWSQKGTPLYRSRLNSQFKRKQSLVMLR